MCMPGSPRWGCLHPTIQMHNTHYWCPAWFTTMGLPASYNTNAQHPLLMPSLVHHDGVACILQYKCTTPTTDAQPGSPRWGCLHPTIQMHNTHYWCPAWFTTMGLPASYNTNAQHPLLMPSLVHHDGVACILQYKCTTPTTDAQPGSPRWGCLHPTIQMHNTHYWCPAWFTTMGLPASYNTNAQHPLLMPSLVHHDGVACILQYKCTTPTTDAQSHSQLQSGSCVCMHFDLPEIRRKKKSPKLLGSTSTVAEI